MSKWRLPDLRKTWNEYPRAFWMMVFVNFVDHLGGSLIYPFFALYTTKRFNVGMTEVGGLFAIWTLSSFIGGFLGGALTDKFGRKRIIIFSLIATAFTILLMGVVDTLEWFFIIGFVSGIFTDVGGPAYTAIIADLLPEEKRAKGYSINRVAFNLAVVFGPVIGGFIAARSYLALFIIDAVVSSLVAFLVFRLIPETKPEIQPGSTSESTGDSFRGYLKVLRDLPFVIFGLVSTLAWLIYMNMNTSLGVYLRDRHSIPESGYGWILSLNAAMVVLFQFPITHKLEKRPPMLMMALGTALMGLGFVLYGVFNTFTLFLVAMAVITLGEMVMMPVSNALVASFAPEDMRGRYTFIYGLSWGIAFAIGPWMAGLVLDGTRPEWLWYACGILGIVTTLGYLALWRSHKTPEKVDLGEAEE